MCVGKILLALAIIPSLSKRLVWSKCILEERSFGIMITKTAVNKQICFTGRGTPLCFIIYVQLNTSNPPSNMYHNCLLLFSYNLEIGVIIHQLLIQMGVT